MQLPTRSLSAVFASLICACSTTPTTASVEQAATVALTTDASSYDAADTITVTFDGLPGDPTDWIAIAPVGTDDGAYVVRTYTDGSTAGSVMFDASMPPGIYVARAYPMDTMVREGESAAFEVSLDGVSLTTDKAVYATSDNVLVTYGGFTTDPTNWITLVPDGSPIDAFDEWHYTTGEASGQMTFGPRAEGLYEVRAYFHGSITLVARVDITIGNPGGATLVSSQAAYPTGAQVSIQYANLPGNATDWIGIYPTGADDFGYIAWTYTNGTAAGTAVFSGLPNGTYEGRVFEAGGLNRLATTAPFTVGGASVSTTSPVYPGTPIEVSYAGLTADPTNWITIVPAGSPPASFNEWHYTNGTASGTMQFGGLALGSYEIRAYYANGIELAASAAFDVVAAPSGTVSTNQTTYTSTDSITVLYDGAPGNANDWVGISVAGSSAVSYVAWTYINGEVTGSRTFGALPPGNYEARLYLDNSATIVDISTFTVLGGSVSATAATYTVGQPVTIQFAGLPGHPLDWVGIYAPGGADDAFIAWQYAGGQAGTVTFTGLPAGTYEARTYLNDSYTLAARSASTFTISP